MTSSSMQSEEAIYRKCLVTLLIKQTPCVRVRVRVCVSVCACMALWNVLTWCTATAGSLERGNEANGSLVCVCVCVCLCV